MIDHWDKRFLDMAVQVSEWSKDPGHRIGAVFVSPTRLILSTGWNGFPRGIQDDARLEDRETKLKFVVHAEMNGIYNACHNGVSLNGSTLYVHGLPVCSECAKGVIQVGVQRVVCDWHGSADAWKESFKLTMQMFNEAGVRVDVVHEDYY